MKSLVCHGHQGDIAIFSLDEFPLGERFEDQQTKALILAIGENSGHNHVFDDSSAVDLFKVRDKKYNGITFVNVKKKSALTHGRIKGFNGVEADEFYHNVIFLDPGLYATGIVEETDWITGTIRKVID